MQDKSPKPFFFEGRKRTKLVTFGICLLISSLFWVFNALSSDYTSNVKYPVQLVYNKNKYVLLDKPSKRVELKVSGYGWNILAISTGYGSTPLIVTPDQLFGKSYITKSEVLPKLRELLAPLVIEELLQDSIPFALEPMHHKEIILKASSAVNTDSVMLEPEIVHVSGPLSEVKLLPDTLTIEVSQKTGRKGELTLELPLKSNTFCKWSPISVKLKASAK